jgi:hypothetical protein
VHKIPKTKTKWGPRFVFEVLKGRPQRAVSAMLASM